MKKLLSYLTILWGIGGPCFAAFPITPYVQITTGAVQAGGFSTQNGKVGNLTITGSSVFQEDIRWTKPTLIDGQCLGLDASGFTTTYICGNGGGAGGAGSTLGVNQNGVAVTTPTFALNFLSPPFKLSAVGGGTTAQFTLDPSSVTLYGPNIPAAAISAGSLRSGVIGSSLAVNSVYPGAVLAASYGNVTIPAANVASGSLGSAVIASSIAVASVGVPQMNFSGTPNSSTFARGDGVWVSSAAFGFGTITGVTAGAGLSGGGTSGTVTLSASGVSLSSQTTGILPIANGGNGTSTPQLLQGSNIILTGSWPNYTINAVGAAVGGNIPTINTASQYSIPFYSTSGSSNTLSGSANFSYNQTTVTLLGPFVASTATVTGEYCFADGTCQTTAASGSGNGGAFSSFYLVDSGSGKWKVTVDLTGHLVSTSVSAIPAGSLAPHQLVTQDSSFNLWTITINTSGDLVTTLGGTTAQSITDILLNDPSNITWVLTVDTTGHLVTS